MTNIRVFFQRCVFPQAFKPWQKALCATTGATSLGVTAYGLSYTLPYIESGCDKVGKAICNQLDKRSKKENVSSMLSESDATTLFLSGSTSFLLAGVAGIGSVICGTVLGKDGISFYRHVKGTSECCNIVRKAFFYSMRTPVFGGMLALNLLGMAMFLTSSYEDFNTLYTRKSEKQQSS